MVSFKQRLKELMLEFNINRFQLSKKLNISSTTMNGYFNDGYFPHIEIAIKMSDYFNCSLDYLFGITDNYEKICDFNIDKILINFNKNFKIIIDKNNLSIAKAMERLRMSEYNYFRWKKGKFPKTMNLINIALYFNESIDCLLCDNGL